MSNASYIDGLKATGRDMAKRGDTPIGHTTAASSVIATAYEKERKKMLEEKKKK